MKMVGLVPLNPFHMCMQIHLLQELLGGCSSLLVLHKIICQKSQNLSFHQFILWYVLQLVNQEGTEIKSMESMEIRRS